MAVSWTVPVWVCASTSWLARGTCCPRLTAGAAGCRAKHSGTTWFPIPRLIASGGFPAHLRCVRWTSRPYRWFGVILAGSVGARCPVPRRTCRTHGDRFVPACVDQTGGRWTPCHSDGEIAFLTSANLTGHAMEKNFEAGILIRGGEMPRDISKHLQGLIDTEIISKAYA